MNAMRFEVCLLFKKRPTERCEVFGRMPRRIASSAISRWLCWLIGRSLSGGFSQVITINAQICSGVYIGAAPDRGACESRSGIDCGSAASRHRIRQYRTVSATPNSRPLPPTPSAVCKMMRARRASGCGVEWHRTKCSSYSRCSGKMVTDAATNRRISNPPSLLLIRHATPRAIRLLVCDSERRQRLHHNASTNCSHNFRLVMKIATGFMAAKFLFTANKIGLFEALASGPANLTEIAGRISVPLRTTGIVVAAMVGLGLIEQEGARYRNSVVVAAFLVGRPALNLRPMLEYFDAIISAIRYGRI